MTPACPATVPLSTKNTFDDNDWAGAGEGWTELTDVEAQKDLIQNARSIRIIIEDESGENEEALFPRGSVIQLSFNAQMEDPENKTKPGDIAWNSFGYQYSITLGGRMVDLIAAPLVVGVKVPEVPRLQKRLVDENGATMLAEKEMTFDFLIYSGEPIAALDRAEKMRMQDIAQVLADNERDVYYAPITVKEGASSASQQLGDGKCWTYQGGKWVETEENWTWHHDATYTVLENLRDVANFRLKTLNNKPQNNVSFPQNGRVSASLVGINEHYVPQYGELKIIKSLARYEDSEPATFVFDVTAVLEEETVYTNVAAITLPGDGEALLTGIPVGAEVTVTEVYSGARYKATGDTVQQTVILSPEDADAPATVSFANDYDDSLKGGHGIQNSFETKPDPNDPDGYVWAEWEKPDMNNP